MRVWSLLKRIGKACVSFVANGIDYACYVLDEFRNVQQEDWPEGKLTKVKEEMDQHQFHNSTTSTGKINLRMQQND